MPFVPESKAENVEAILNVYNVFSQLRLGEITLTCHNSYAPGGLLKRRDNNRDY